MVEAAQTALKQGWFEMRRYQLDNPPSGKPAHHRGGG